MQKDQGGTPPGEGSQQSLDLPQPCLHLLLPLLNAQVKGERMQGREETAGMNGKHKHIGPECVQPTPRVEDLLRVLVEPGQVKLRSQPDSVEFDLEVTPEVVQGGVAQNGNSNRLVGAGFREIGDN